MKVEVELLSPLYQELHEEMGEKVMLDFYKLYRGLTLNVPQKLYDSKKVKRYLILNYGKENLSRTEMKKIISQFGYSERHIYRMLKNEKI